MENQLAELEAKIDALTEKVDATNKGIADLINEVKQTGATLMDTVNNSPIGSLIKGFARK